jgi:phage recombination protein Bet
MNQLPAAAHARLPMPPDAAVTASVWKVLTDVIFPNAKSPESIVMALAYCRARKLDIMKRPVNIVPMWDSKRQDYVETVWPSINEHHVTAARAGWAGMDEPIWGPDKRETFRGRIKTGKNSYETVEFPITFPEWCTVPVYRVIDGQRCRFAEPVYWLETYARRQGTAIPAPMWIRRPRMQLHKCSKAANLRAAFPEECGEYTSDEMEGKSIDEVPGSGDITAEADKVEWTGRDAHRRADQAPNGGRRTDGETGGGDGGGGESEVPSYLLDVPPPDGDMGMADFKPEPGYVFRQKFGVKKFKKAEDWIKAWADQIKLRKDANADDLLEEDRKRNRSDLEEIKGFDPEAARRVLAMLREALNLPANGGAADRGTQDNGPKEGDHVADREQPGVKAASGSPQGSHNPAAAP